MLIVYKSTFSPYYCRLSLEVGPSPLDQIIAVQISLLLTCFCYFAGSLGLFLTLLVLWDPGVRFLGKNGYSTALCGAHGISLFIKSSKSWLGSFFMVWRMLAEVSQIIGFLKRFYTKLGHKNQNLSFFKYPSWNFKNKASGVYPHQIRAPHTKPILANLKPLL